MDQNTEPKENDPVVRPAGRIIGVVSAKGGVGKTTVTVNLGAVLAKYFGAKSIVIDANVTGANMGLHLNLIHPPVTLEDVFKNRINMTQSTYVHDSGLHVIPSSLYTTSTPKLAHFVERVESLKDKYDFILLDSAPCMNREAILVLKSSQEIIIVTTPDYPSVAMSMKVAKVARAMKKEIIGVVVNKMMSGRGTLSIEQIEKAIESVVIGVIPFDKKTTEALYYHTPLILYAPSSKASLSITDVAERLAGRVDHSFLDRLRRKFSM